ncbi:MAG: hypothetical protein QOC85_1193, partial [Streptomyces sp.]|nr:hypothetical protein [Streptomyces sp.]
MSITRRTLLGTALAATAGLSTAQHANALPAPLDAQAPAASPPGDVVGKVSVGYQGWFACTGDGAPINGWWHWSQDMSRPPSLSNTTIKSWPDMREYSRGFATAYPNLNSGAPARLFSSWDQQTVDTQFRWM